MTFPSGSSQGEPPQGYGGYQGQLPNYGSNPQDHQRSEAGQASQPTAFVSAPQGPPQQGQPQQGNQSPMGTQQLRPVAPKRPNPVATIGIGQLLSLAVFVLGFVSYFISFSASGGVGIEIYLLLAGGLFCGMSVLRKPPSGALAGGTVLSVVGALGMLTTVVIHTGVPTSLILVLVFGILQLLAAVGAYLVHVEVLTVPPQGPRQSPPGQQPPQPPYPGGYPAPAVPAYGQPQNQPHTSGPGRE